MHEGQWVGTIVDQRSYHATPELIWRDIRANWWVKVVAQGKTTPNDGQELPKNVIPCHHNLLPLATRCFNCS
jgi:hypothetical protein